MLSPMQKVVARILGTALCLSVSAAAQEVKLPLKEKSTRFAVLGDTGTGGRQQVEVAQKVEDYRKKVNFNFAILLGDNIYGSERPQDFAKKFEQPYKALLDAGVKFYAALGNHDEAAQTQFKLFNMGGQKYYTFKPQNGVRFFAIDSNYVDQKQLQWLDKELEASGSDWKIVFFHHPLYSSGGTHGSADVQRDLIEPVLIKHGVNVAFMGHEHFYERIKPQKGVAYFIVGSSSKLRRGDLRKSNLTVYGNDTDYTFLLVEIVGDELFFQAISDKGMTLDTGSIRRVGDAKPNPGTTTQPVAPQSKPSPVQPGPTQK